MTIANEIELEPFAPSATSGKSVLASPWPFLGSVKIQVSVRVGGTDITVADLLAMKHGSVLTLDRLVDEPLDVLVDEHVVARGVLVGIGEHFGVRLTEVATAGMPGSNRA